MKTIKTTILVAIMAFFAMAANAQMQDPVHFTVTQKQVSPTEVDVIFTGKIDAGWHVYSTGLPADGPISATINTEKAEGAKADGKLKAQGKEINKFDKLFDMTLRYFENNVTFIQRYKVTGKTYNIKGYLEYGACNDQNCMPPTSVEFDFKGEGPKDAPEAKEEKKNEEVEDPAALAANLTDGANADSLKNATDSVTTAAVAPLDSTEVNSLWKPVIKELQAFNGEDHKDRSLLYIFLMGLLGGLVALFTPCVWPIIPMTVSFFLKRAKDDKKKGIKDAITYGISIVVIYLALGLAITAIFGASALNALSTNAIFNIFFCLLLVVFALSFFGWFELTLPASWTNKVDSKASSTSGLLSIFLMAFTLSLVSFSCTGPIIGFLLVDFATSGNFWGPAIGMFGFALALALPFTLFAMFPTWLKKAPKSGGWMNIIKVTLGFIELAFALKFFSVADLAYGWRLLDREVFLCLWIVIFGAMGAYLLNIIRLPHDQDEYDETGQVIQTPRTGIVRLMAGLASVAFALYMLPGLWGAPCKAVSAFAPPVSTQDFNLYTREVTPQFQDYDQGMAYAREHDKPVMLDFTGYGCVNCRKMEAAVWTDPQVADIINDRYVLITLHVDDKTPLSAPLEVVEMGQKRTLRTVGDRWSYLQRHRFGANAQPFYVLLDKDGQPLAPSYGYDEDVQAYIDWLRSGLR